MSSLAQSHRATSWVVRIFDRIPMPYPITTIILGAILVGLNLWLLQSMTNSSMRAQPYSIPRQIAPPIISVYCLFAIMYLHNATRTLMTTMRSILLVADDEYERLTHTMLTVDRRIDIAISVLGILVAVGSFVYQMTQVRVASAQGRFSVMNGVQGLQLALLGLCVGLLVYAGIERAIGLYRLLNQPLAINFFDTSNLAPLSQLSLKTSLALIGLVSLPIVLFGGAAFVAATQILIYSAGAISALMAFALPFWGLHRHMVAARDKELDAINPRLNTLYRQLIDRADDATRHEMIGEINALATYRTVLKSAAMWPYASTRILFQAAIPILLPIVSYLIQQRVAPIISDWIR
jgi:hypothetical protein